MENYHCHQLYFSYATAPASHRWEFIRGISAASDIRVFFSFSCTFFVDVWKFVPHFGQPVFQETVTRPVAGAHLCLLYCKMFDDPDNALRSLNSHLDRWPLTADQRSRLVEFAFNTAVFEVLHAPDFGNVIRINVHAEVIHRHVFGEERLIDLAIRRSLIEHAPTMTPTAESVIEKLKGVTLESEEGGEEENCTICLEGMEGGYEATSLQCKHVFHGDCIKKWLRESHYCPICRFVMPTD